MNSNLNFIQIIQIIDAFSVEKNKCFPFRKFFRQTADFTAS